METNKKLQNLIGAILNKDYFKLKIGEYIYVEDKDGEFSYRQPEKHLIKGFIYPEWNDIVPSSIETCCGTYKPTSRNDGYWENDMKLGGWDYYGQEPTLLEILLAIQEKISALQPTKDKGIVCIWTKKAEPIYINLEKSIFNQEESVKVKIINLLEDK